MSQDGLTLKIDNDFLAISALIDDAKRTEERVFALVAEWRAVIGKHFGQVVAMHDTRSIAERLDRELTYLKTRAGITAETPENRCGHCWTLRWNDDGPCRGCEWMKSA